MYTQNLNKKPYFIIKLRECHPKLGRVVNRLDSQSNLSLSEKKPSWVFDNWAGADCKNFVKKNPKSLYYRIS